MPTGRSDVQGQFIYIKYAFDKLAGQKQCTIDELEVLLPTGLSGMFEHVMGALHQALRKDRRKDLLDLLTQRVLPVLVVAKDPMTVEELVWATGGKADQASQIKHLPPWVRIV